MRDRDVQESRFHNYQNKYRQLTLVYHGWVVGPTHNYHRTNIHPLDIPARQGAAIVYTLYGTQQIRRVVFPSKRKREYQWEINPLDDLRIDHIYTVYCLNLKYDKRYTSTPLKVSNPENWNKPGDWIWAAHREVTPRQAQNIMDYKNIREQYNDGHYDEWIKPERLDKILEIQ